MNFVTSNVGLFLKSQGPEMEGNDLKKCCLNSGGGGVGGGVNGNDGGA